MPFAQAPLFQAPVLGTKHERAMLTSQAQAGFHLAFIAPSFSILFSAEAYYS
jgi:hypothetical protein